MISVTEKSRLAILALAELARRGGACPVPILEIADARDIPVHLLEQLFANLRRAGILQSQRGVKGGYSFRRPPADVSVLDVVEAVDGPLATAPPRAALAAASDMIWDEARRRVAELFRELSIGEVAEREARLQAAPMFHI